MKGLWSRIDMTIISSTFESCVVFFPEEFYGGSFLHITEGKTETVQWETEAEPHSVLFNIT